MLRLAIATTLIAATATVSGKSTSTGIAERSRLENSQEEHYEKEKREWDGNRSAETGGLYPHQESSEDELADAVSHRDVGYQNTGNAVNEQPQQSIVGGWQDTIPGTPGMDYPNLERIPVTSFTCSDKEPGGYYADAETGCQVFHVCNTGGVKSSFLCPPGSIFNQKHFVCDWWYSFDCDEAVGLYFKKSNENFEDEKEVTSCVDYEDSGNCDKVYENDETGEGSELISGKHSEDVRITNENLANDLSLASSGRGAVNYFSREASLMDPSNIKQKNINVVVNDSENAEKPSNNENTPRGFSRNEDKFLKFTKYDKTTRLPDVTNNLASYVNYAYFEAGLNVQNNDDNENIQYENFDENETKEMLDTSFGDKYVYGEKFISGYSSSDDKYDSSKRIEEV